MLETPPRACLDFRIKNQSRSSSDNQHQVKRELFKSVTEEMAAGMKVCDIDEQLKAQLKKFRFRKDKTIAAIVCKIQETTVVIEEQFDDVSLEELQEEVSSTQARYIFLSYCLKHSDGRVSYPLCFIYLHPRGTKPEQSMKYSGTKLFLQQESGVTKCFDLTSVEDLTQEWLEEKLSFFH